MEGRTDDLSCEAGDRIITGGQRGAVAAGAATDSDCSA